MGILSRENVKKKSFRIQTDFIYLRFLVLRGGCIRWNTLSLINNLANKKYKKKEL